MGGIGEKNGDHTCVVSLLERVGAETAPGI